MGALPGETFAVCDFCDMIARVCSKGLRVRVEKWIYGRSSDGNGRARWGAKVVTVRCCSVTGSGGEIRGERKLGGLELLYWEIN